MENVQLSVTDCIALINQTLDYAYPAVTVVGEVSSFKVNQGKYVFFDLKDDQSTMPCFMTVWQLRQPLEDGMKVMVVAQPKITAWGKFSMTVREVRPVGEGSLKRAFELLVKKLQAEGLFDEARKRSLPMFPEHIGVISSTQAAGYADFIKILNDRWGGMRIDVAHVQVQGMAAPGQIMRALEHFNEMAEPPEVVVLLRGGGSADDLAAFNDEPLARAIAASRVVTLVGVGHEVDTSLADMVCDVRAATPSNAAQLLVPDRSELLRQQQLMMSRTAKVICNRYDELSQVSRHAVGHMLRHLEAKLGQLVETHKNMQQTLGQINPRTVLNRGYSLVRTEAGIVVRGNAEEVKPGQKLTVELEKAIITAGVIDVSQK
ncbi:MAG TPA: exodeoxyribonuclease VII large subunit [Verrucomicrobiae bacterium]|nr:exodeoxyribonuclease VII large subunit [Verrucomicrobiae bacterium]